MGARLFWRGQEICKQVLFCDGISVKVGVWLRWSKRAKILKSEGYATTICDLWAHPDDREGGVWLIRGSQSLI